MTEPGRSALKPGHWVLIGLVVLLVAGLVAVVISRSDGDSPHAQTTTPTVSPSTSALPACQPTVTEIGYTRDGARFDVGLIAASDCPAAAVDSQVEVSAIGEDGRPVKVSDALQPQLPVILPGQKLGLAATLLLDDRSAKVTRLQATITGAVPVPTAEFAGWARSVTVTGITHTGPDARGLSTITGTVTTDPASTALCNPQFNLILRDKANKIIYGTTGTARTPTFQERFPAATDYDNTQVYVVQGAPATLSIDLAATASCRSQ